MRTRYIFAFLFLGFSHPLAAQSDTTAGKKNQVTYYNNFLAGGLLGKSEQGSALTLSVINGIRIKCFSIGGGVGFDSYVDWKTLPLYGSVNFDFGKIKQNAFFIQFNAGYSKAWRIKKEVWEPEYNISGGEMISSLVGYRIMAKQFSIYLSAGHKFQQIRYSQSLGWDTQSRVSVEESINRLVVQIGFGLH